MHPSISCRTCDKSLNIELTDKRLYEIKCEDGHWNTIIIQSHLFELFFDLGCFAYFEGYYREAVFNFYSALEHFREFFIKTILNKRNISLKKVNSLWKTLNTSERQLGAYNLLLTLESNSINGSKQQEASKTRNEVIHKGKIPTTDEAFAFGENIFEEIKNTYFLNFQKDPAKNLTNEFETFLEDYRENHNKYLTQTIYTYGFQLARSQKIQIFEEHLSNFKIYLKTENSWYRQRNDKNINYQSL